MLDSVKNPRSRLRLQTLPNTPTLGPAKSHANELKELTKLESLLFSSSVPIYRDGHYWRVSVLVNEELPLTMSWDESLTYRSLRVPWLKRSVWKWQRLGAPERLIVNKQPIAMRPVEVSSIRIGNAVKTKSSSLCSSAGVRIVWCSVGISITKHTGMRIVPDLLQVQNGDGTG